MAAPSRRFQLVIWGATGFVGQLVCERIATEYPNQLRVALAGRSRSKLERVRADMTAHDYSFKDTEIMVADADDREAIDVITASTEIVVSCAGPYRRYSSTMVASCVANGTHYLDISVEMPWIRSNIRDYHETAVQNEAKIVHFCGIGSVPADLGTLLLVQTIRHRYNMGCRYVVFCYEDYKTGAGGGSIASVVDIYASSTDSHTKALNSDPYCFTPQHLNHPSGGKHEGVRYNEELKSYMVPTAAANFEAGVVQRSNALANEPYAKDFFYYEGVTASSWIAAWCKMLFMSFFAFIVSTSLGQRLLTMMTPPPGSGPSLEIQREKGFWRIGLIGYPEDANAKHVSLKLADNHGNPGHWSTSKMLLECALSLLFEKEKVDQQAALKGGVLTPALAFGCVPLERLKRLGGFIVDVST